MNKEKLTEAKENKTTVFLRMSETPNRPLEVKEVSVKKIFTEKPRSLNLKEDTISARVKLANRKCLMVLSDQLFSNYESALLGRELNHEKPEQNPSAVFPVSLKPTL
jgi:hypothetical protein